MKPEMLWESSDPDVELRRRFGFASTGEAQTWVSRVLTIRYGIDVAAVERMVISAHNLMIWLTTAAGRRLLMKICRLTEAHDWLAARAELVGWLADRGLPVAAPLRSLGGDLQLLCNGRSVGVQPVFPGQLLDADDLDQVRAAGSTLASLHTEMASWTGAELLADVRPVAGGDRLWVYPPGHLDRVPADLQERLEQHIVDLPELPRQPVHADFRGANILCQEGKISAVLDFEESRIDAAVVDLAHAACLLATWYRNWRPMNSTAQQAFLDSYTSHRPLTDAEQTWLLPLIGWGMLGQGWWQEAARWLR